MGRSETPPQIELTWDQALSWRVRRHLLVEPSSDPIHTVAVLGGVQAQVASASLQVMAIRSSAVPDLDDLLWQRRSLVKTWAMRGTLHLLPSNELGMWISALRQRKWRITPAWEKYHGISGAQLHAITEAIPLVLSDEPLTRKELAAAIVTQVGDPELGEALSSGWSQVLKPAANQGLLAQGPPSGRSVTFVDPRAWVPDSVAEPAPEAAMRTVLKRFLGANGPATVEDFSRWFGIDTKTGKDLMIPYLKELAQVSVEGHMSWMTVRGAEEASMADSASGTYLLPGFDTYTLAPISHRSHTIPQGRVDDVSRAAGWIAPVILDNGRIIGTWETESGSTIALRPFGKLAKSKLAAIREHVESRYHRLLGSDPRLVVT